MRRAGKYQDALVHAGGFNHAAVLGDIAEQDCQPALAGVGVLQGAYAAAPAVPVQAGPAGVLAEGRLGGNAGRASAVEFMHRGIFSLHDVPCCQRLAHGGAVDCGAVSVQQAGAIQLAEDAHDTPGPVHVFHMVQGGVGRDLAQLRHLAGQPVDIRQGEIQLGFLGCGQQVQDGVGGAAHGDIQAHGVLERLKTADTAR